MGKLIMVAMMWVWAGSLAIAQELPLETQLTVESFPSSQVYLETATGPTYLGHSGQTLTVKPPVMTDRQGRPTQYLNGMLVLKCGHHADFRVTVTSQDWAQGHLPPAGGHYDLVPNSAWVGLVDSWRGHPLAWVTLGLGLVGGALAAWRWRRLARTRGAENQLLSGRLKSTGDPLLGKALGKYTVEARLGQGGMGTVYRVIDAEGGQFAAKVIYFSAGEEAQLHRFRREFRVISQLRHPSLVRGFDYGEDEGVAYGVMELVVGRTLDHFIKPEGSSWEDVWPWIRAILEGLGCAHAQGVVHRDLKPTNIMICQEGVKLLDFGLARQTDRTVVTQTGKAMGTPAYVAPEQISASGGEIEPRTDIYSLGVIMFELLTGRRPFEAATPGEMLVLHATQTPPLMSHLVAGIPPQVDRCVATMLAKQPANRPPSAERVLEILSALKTGEAQPSSDWGQRGDDEPTAELKPPSGG